MSITTAGKNHLAAKIMSDAAVLSHLGVGNGNTVFSVAQTDLQGASKLRKAFDGGYPTSSGGAVTAQATFGPAEANFTWEEWGLFTAASGGVMLNRVVANNSTKLSGQTWIFKVTLTLNLG